MPSEERAELRGRTLDGRWALGACIGVGGTGVVFEATRLSDGHPCVVKTLRPVYAYNRDLCRRLRREGEVARVVSHPAIVPAIGEGLLDDGSPYVVLERIHGEGLHRLLRRVDLLPEDEVAAIALRVLDVLQHAHAHGYVHRDVKPEHVVLEALPDGTLGFHLLDFGVCAAESAPHDERERERGRVFGTPSYVSPEQASGNPDVDGRADLFGLGIVLFEALTGRLPFSGANVTMLLKRIIREEAPRLSSLSAVSPAMEAVVARLLARKREGRYANARAAMRALRACCPDRAAAEARLASRLEGAEGRFDTMPTRIEQTAA
ncbi:MAG: serine/threonine-protein kinase [Myxococcota bacterium]